jgi:hypothetical protein
VKVVVLPNGSTKGSSRLQTYRQGSREANVR